MKTQNELALHSFKNCPICNSQKLEVKYHNLADPMKTVEPSFDIVACGNCHLNFTNPQIKNEDLGFLYEGNYFGIGNKLSFFEEVYIQDQYRYDFGFIKDKIPTNARLLDFGCGNGQRLAFYRSKGINAFGIDEFAMITANVEPERIIIQNPIHYFPAEKYDVVTLYHVLEHLRELEDQILHIKKNILKPNGILQIQVPNIDCWQLKKKPTYSPIFEVPRHFWHFNDKSLMFLLEKQGFEIVKSKAKNSFLHPGVLLNTVFKFDIRDQWANPNAKSWKILLKFAFFSALSMPIAIWENWNNNSFILNVLAKNK